jgi:hypothetical protein
MEDLGQDFQAFDDARSRTIEILIAVRDKDAALLHRLQLVPTGAAQAVASPEVFAPQQPIFYLENDQPLPSTHMTITRGRGDHRL